MKLLASFALGLTLNVAAGDRDADKIIKFIETAVIPKIRFKDVTAEEAIEYLRIRSIELDPDREHTENKGVSVVTRRPRPDKSEVAAGLKLGNLSSENLPKLKITLDNVSIRAVPEEIARQAKLDVYITTDGVLLCPTGAKPFPNNKELAGRLLSRLYHYKASPTK